MNEPMGYCTFRLGTALFGIAVAEVREVSMVSPLTPVAHAPSMVSGYVNLRGQIHLVLDLRQLLGLERGVLTADSRLLIVKPHVAEALGVLVDQIGDIIWLNGDEIVARRATEEETVSAAVSSELISGVGKLQGELLVLLDPYQLATAIEQQVAQRATR